jgi:hypothetical protein
MMMLLSLLDEVLIEENLRHLSLFFILICHLRLFYCQHDLLFFFIYCISHNYPLQYLNPNIFLNLNTADYFVLKILHERTRSKQRTSHHRKDMGHAHRMEKSLKPEMSEKPSALWQKREVFLVGSWVIL